MSPVLFGPCRSLIQSWPTCSWFTAVTRTTAVPGLVGGGEVDLGGEAPVVVAGRVVEDLPGHPPPGLLVEDQQSRTARVRAGADLGVFLEVGRERLAPRPSASKPASASSSPSATHCRRAASSTRRNRALRTSTRKARTLAVTGGGFSSSTVARPATASSGMHQPFPLVEQAGVDLADHLAEPGDQVLELLGAGLLRHGLPQRPGGVGEVAQHDALGAGEAVEVDVVGEGHRLLEHLAGDRLGRQLEVGDPRMPLAVDVEGALRAASSSGFG